jgi:hypothetical protein
MGSSVLTPGLETRGSGGVGVCLQFERSIFKAQPEVEGGQRVVYLEASTEIRDMQGDKILLSALEASIPYFLKYGRLDLDHASVLGQIRGAKVNPYAFEIGRPLDVRLKDGSIWVKAAIFSGTGGSGSNSFTEAADLFWDSLHTHPPVIWYPSVAGDVYSEETTTEGGLPTQEVRGIRWHSIGLSRTPVNTAVGSVTTMPVRAFAKAFSGLADLKDTLGALAPTLPKRGLSTASSRVVGADDPIYIRLAMDALLEAQESGGIDGYLTLATERGVPAEVAMALLVVLLSRH